MEDVNKAPAASAGSGENQTPSPAEALNTEKVSGTIPYDRFQEIVTEKATLAEQNRQLQERLQQLNRSNSTPQQSTPNYQQQPQNQQSVDIWQQMVDQYGHDGAKPIYAAHMQSQQAMQQIGYTLAYQQKHIEGRIKFGDKWDQFNYQDQFGNSANKVVDLVAKGLTVEQAWNALNTVDVEKIKQEALNEAHQKVQGKLQGTPPATGQGVGGAAAGAATSKPKTIAEAWALAEAKLS